METIDTEKLFEEIEKDLEALQMVTARTLIELDAHASADLSRWLGEWTYLEDLTKSP